MKKVVIDILLSAILFSTMEVALKVASFGIDPFQMTFIRFLIGGLCLLPFAMKEIKKREITFVKSDYTYLLLIGILNIVISMSFFQFGVMNTKASIAAVIFCTNPMFTMFFAHFLTDEKMNRRKALALLVSIIGLLFIMNPFNLNGADVKGMLLSFSSALTFGLYSAVGKKRIHKLGGLAQTSISFIFGSLALLVILIITKRPIISGIHSSEILLLLYICIAVTGLGYLFYFMAMEKSNASVASLVFFVKPAIAPIFAVVLLREVIKINLFFGIAFILVGSYINMNKIKIHND